MEGYTMFMDWKIWYFVCVCVCVCDDRAKQGDSEYLVPIPMRHSNKNNSHIYG